MIAEQEYQTRMENLQRKVSENGLEAFLVSSEESIYYLTGVSYRPFERPFFICAWPASPATLLVPALEEAHLQEAPNVGKVCTYWDYPSPLGKGWAERLMEVLGNISRLGIEPSLSQEISNHLSGFALQVLPLVEQLRLVKSAAEVEMVRQAARYADMGVKRVIAAAYHDVSELELFAQGRGVQLQIMRDTEYDAPTTSVLVAAWPAPLSAQPHGMPAIGDRLKGGPHIAFGFLRVNGYAAECERTFFLRRADEKITKAFAAMLEARRRGLAMVRPGVRCAELDATVNAFLREEGYKERLLHRTGHGFGLGLHEGPWIAEGSDEVLRENMIVSVEPGIYFPGEGGVRHSDTVLVTEDGHELLTHYPVDLEGLTSLAYKPIRRVIGCFMRRAAGMK